MTWRSMRVQQIVMPAGKQTSLTGGSGLRFQLVNATHWLNRWAGVSKSSVLRGRSFSCRATAFSLAWE
jgi:hypothetical protein